MSLDNDGRTFHVDVDDHNNLYSLITMLLWSLKSLRISLFPYHSFTVVSHTHYYITVLSELSLKSSKNDSAQLKYQFLVRCWPPLFGFDINITLYHEMKFQFLQSSTYIESFWIVHYHHHAWILTFQPQ